LENNLRDRHRIHKENATSGRDPKRKTKIELRKGKTDINAVKKFRRSQRS